MLRSPHPEIRARLLTQGSGPGLEGLLRDTPDDTLSAAVRDLGGHDIDLLLDTFRGLDPTRPTVVFAYTVKGRDLPTEAHPNNHSALLTPDQMDALARASGVDRSTPWQRFSHGTTADQLCRDRAAALQRGPVPDPGPPIKVPPSLGHGHRRPVSTQAALGRLLGDLHRDAPEVAAHVVTCSPDVASSTNLGGWINRTGVWAVQERHDWFADDAQRVLQWSEQAEGQHIELGIAEVNLVSLLGELGSTWSRWGHRLIPIGTLYDAFVPRALEPWSYGLYAGGQSILVGTPSGVTLAAEGGAHQSISTPSIGLEQPGCVAWEPAFAQDLEWCFLAAMATVGVPGGTSAYFRLSTRPIDPALAQVPQDPALLERRRRQAIAGGYRMPTEHSAIDDQVTLVGVGSIMPEVMRAAEVLRARHDLKVGVACLTSPDLVFRSMQQRHRRRDGAGGGIVDEILPAQGRSVLVTVIDGHPHTLAFLAGARGDRIRCLGVTEFGQSSSLTEAYKLHDIDEVAIVDAALTLLGL